MFDRKNKPYEPQVICAHFDTSLCKCTKPEPPKPEPYFTLPELAERWGVSLDVAFAVAEKNCNTYTSHGYWTYPSRANRKGEYRVGAVESYEKRLNEDAAKKSLTTLISKEAKSIDAEAKKVSK